MKRSAKIVLVLAGLAVGGWLTYAGLRPRDDPPELDRDRAVTPLYETGEVVRIDLAQRSFVLREDARARAIEVSVAIDPALTIIQLGDRRVEIDEIHTGDHAVVKLLSPKLAGEVRLARNIGEE